jgi:hypothetical protein
MIANIDFSSSFIVGLCHWQQKQQQIYIYTVKRIKSGHAG